MTIIRVTGGNGGIEDYLQKGNKAGREFDRDELDERILISGDIDTLRAVNKLNRADRIKYTHITLAVKEDMIDVNVLKEMFNDYIYHIFSAYRKDEYYVYAEIHMPKIKSYIADNGEKIIRLPHLHIVVPNLNLLTGQAINPWGLYEHNLQYFDAIQENINIKFGTISPSQSRRTQFTKESNIHERKRADIFLDYGKETKAKILKEILKSDRFSTERLRELLKILGDHKTVNLGKMNEYEAVRVKGTEKFINLRHYVFSPSFLILSREEKLTALEPEDNGKYTAIGAPGEAPRSIQELLREWHEIKSKQIKYFPGGSNLRYKSMNYDDKKQFLENRAEEFYQKQGIAADLHVPLVTQAFPSRVRLVRPQPSLVATNNHTGRRFDTPVSQMLRDARQAAKSAELAYAIALVPGLNQAVDLEFLLQELVLDVGLMRTKYEITGDEAPGSSPIMVGRIRCGTRSLNAIDFLTHEMRMSFADAFKKLKEVVEKQNNHIANLDPQKSYPDPILWKRFYASRRIIKRQLQAQYQTEIEELRADLAVDIEKLAEQHDFEKFRLYQTKMPAVVRELLLANADTYYSASKAEIITTYSKEKRLHRQKRPAGRNWDFYLIFLRSNSLIDDACRSELQRHSPARRKLHGTYSISCTGTPAAVLDTLVERYGLTREVTEGGDMVYKKHGAQIIRDEGQQIHVIANAFATKVAVTLSQQKWNDKIEVHGSDEVRHSFMQESVAQGVVLKFIDVIAEKIEDKNRKSTSGERKLASANRHQIR